MPGVFAPASPDRLQIVPSTRTAASTERGEVSVSNRQRAMSWEQRLKRLFASDRDGRVLAGAVRRRQMAPSICAHRPGFSRYERFATNIRTLIRTIRSERAVQQSIDELKGDITVVIIAHRLSTIRNVDRVYVLDKGRVMEQGSYRELRNREGSRLGELVDMQSL